MATQAALVLNDGSATPVARTFTPTIPYGGPHQAAIWVCKVGVAPIAYPRIEIGMKRTSNGSTKVSTKVVVPNVTNDPVAGPRLASQALFDSSSGGFVIPDVSTDQQRADLHAYVKNLVAHAAFQTWVRDLEAQY